LLIFIVAYRAETTIKNVLSRIPLALAQRYDTEVLVIDDASADRTFEYGCEVRQQGVLPFPVTVLRNPINQGYGGNQKIGYFYAIRNGFTFVALLHYPEGIRIRPHAAADASRQNRSRQAAAAISSKQQAAFRGTAKQRNRAIDRSHLG